MRIELINEAEKLLTSLKAQNKGRGLTKDDWNFVISEALIGVKSDQWISLINEKTKPEYFVKVALKDENLSQKLKDIVLKKQNKSPKIQKPNPSQNPSQA